MTKRDADLENMWARHSADWRDTAQISSQWREASGIDPRLLESRASRGWWELLEELGITLFVTREYEHLVLGVTASGGKPRLSYYPVPHPSGLAVDRRTGRIFLASTRNPNQVFVLKPVRGMLNRTDVKTPLPPGGLLAPVSSTFYPGSLYLHDLAILGGALYGNGVGHNAVVRLEAEGSFEPVWWPKCIEHRSKPIFARNHIQLNSIATGKTIEDSYFSASSDALGRLRPGHLNYPVDGRGVIFSGKTRETICTGLTRPHSARLRAGTVWVANSGYGEIGFVRDGRLEVVAKLPGWTRGLCILGDTAFVATSRVIPKYARYAPGLDASDSVCAIHALSLKSGAVLGSLEWPYGNQVFAIDWIRSTDSLGFFSEVGSTRAKKQIAFSYSYLTQN